MPEETNGGESQPEKRERKPTIYFAFVEHVGLAGEHAGLTPVMDQRGEPKKFEGFRRTDVLEELVDTEQIEADDESGYTPYVVIIPASSYGRVRARVQTHTSLDFE